MNEKTLRALVEAGAVKRVRIVANGNRFHVEAVTSTATVIAATGKGTPKTWGTLDASAKWVRALGIGTAQLDVSRWRPGQRGFDFMSTQGINAKEAKKLAQHFAGADAELELCEEAPRGLYLTRPAEDEIYFSVLYPEDMMRVGGCAYIAVDRETGAVRDAGYAGE